MIAIPIRVDLVLGITKRHLVLISIFEFYLQLKILHFYMFVDINKVLNHRMLYSSVVRMCCNY